MPRKGNQFQNPEISTKEGRNKVAKEYRPLMIKIVNQWIGKCPLDKDILMMLAEDGLLYAMDHYRKGTSQNFMQYSAWCMRNLILNGISEYGSTVRINSGQRKKLMDKGESVYVTIPITGGDCSDGTLQESSFDPPFDIVPEEKVLKNLTDFVDSNFNDRSKDIFYHTYELKGYTKMKGTELSDKYHCSVALISQINRQVLDSIREQPKLMELLDSIRHYG